MAPNVMKDETVSVDSAHSPVYVPRGSGEIHAETTWIVLRREYVIPTAHVTRPKY